MVRIGTSGGMQPHWPVGSYVVCLKSQLALMELYTIMLDSRDVCDIEFEDAFQKACAIGLLITALRML